MRENEEEHHEAWRKRQPILSCHWKKLPFDFKDDATTLDGSDKQ